MLEIRYLRHILALAKYENFHKAAEAVNISQPALSKSIRKSETLLGEQLFERDASRIKPTRFGEYVIRNAETLMGRVEKFTDEITTFKEDFGNSFRIGIHPFFTAFVSQALTNILPNNTQVCFDFKILSHLEAIEKLRDHQIDFYFGVIRNDYALQYSEIRFTHFPISWYLMAQSDFLSNDEQKLKLRAAFSTGIGKLLVHSNKMILGFSGGVEGCVE